MSAVTVKYILHKLQRDTSLTKHVSETEMKKFKEDALKVCPKRIFAAEDVKDYINDHISRMCSTSWKHSLVAWVFEQQISGLLCNKINEIIKRKQHIDKASAKKHSRKHLSPKN